MDIEDQDVTIVEDTNSAEDDGCDPRKMSAATFLARGYRPRPLLAVIREKCLDCAGGSPLEVRLCGSGNCPLWPFRMGTNPLRPKREMTDDQRDALSARCRRLAETAATARQEKSAGSDVPTSVYKVGDLSITTKQRDAFDIIANAPAKLGDIHGKTLGFMRRAGWVENDAGDRLVSLTSEGTRIATALGLIT